MFYRTRFLNSILFLYAICILGGCDSQKEDIDNSEKIDEVPATSFVNVFIGTGRGESEHPGSRGNTHPGAVVPWGMVACSPQTFDFTKMQLSTGFQDGRDSIYGFSCVNLSGVGCPATGSVPLKFSTKKFRNIVNGSTFSGQIAEPGYYSVHLIEENITVETTATTRSIFFKVQLPKGQSNVYLDLTAQQGHLKGGELLKYGIDYVNGYQWEGFFCGSDTKSKTFFHAELSKKADSMELVYNNQSIDYVRNEMKKDMPSGIVFSYYSSEATTLMIKVGVSFVSEVNAKDNLNSELTGHSFDEIREKARCQWETELGKIKITSSDVDKKVVFYSALYHSLLMPITFSDVNGDYVEQGDNHKIGNAADYVRYTGFSLWDTYRTVHPLLNLVYPERQTDMLKSMLGMYREAGRLPKWEIFAQEPNIMVGDPATIVIADSYLKGIDHFDFDLAYEAMKKQANVVEGNIMRRGLKEYLDIGYISMDGEFSDASNFQWNNGMVWGPVSTTLEFNLSDFCIAQTAKKLGRDDDFRRFTARSLSFLKFYDAKMGLLRPLNSNGSWYEPFDPRKDRWDKMNFGLRGGPGFVEGSAWQYLYSIPHGIDTLQKIMGEDKFLTQLNRLFDEGHFDMSNEPGLGFPFMYNYTTEKYTKTSSTVGHCLETYFQNTTNGLPGNDDAGTMSAWVVFAMMGFYPDTPGSPNYMVTVPSLDKTVITLNPDFYKGGHLVIERQGPKNGRVNSIDINGKESDFKIDHFNLTEKASELIIRTSPID